MQSDCKTGYKRASLAWLSKLNRKWALMFVFATSKIGQSEPVTINEGTQMQSTHSKLNKQTVFYCKRWEDWGGLWLAMAEGKGRKKVGWVELSRAVSVGWVAGRRGKSRRWGAVSVAGRLAGVQAMILRHRKQALVAGKKCEEINSVHTKRPSWLKQWSGEEKMNDQGRSTAGLMSWWTAGG